MDDKQIKELPSSADLHRQVVAAIEATTTTSDASEAASTALEVVRDALLGYVELA